GGFGGAGGFGGFDMGDIFDSFFGGGFSSRSNKNSPRKGRDIVMRVELTFEEAAFGCKKTVTVQNIDKCASCAGSGAKDESSIKTCGRCGGTGQVRTVQNTPFGQFASSTTCPECGGKGRRIDAFCPECGGKGTMRKTSKITVSIPAGIDNGQSVIARGKGDAGQNGGPNGDLVLQIAIKKHPIFVRSDNDVYVEVPITFVQAALGSEIDVPTLHGAAKLNIPEGTQSGKRFKIDAKGIHSEYGGKGDEYVTIIVETPKNLNAKQREALEKFAAETNDRNYKQQRSFMDKLRDHLSK
ncbi:MAG: DnaJ C-terminal domain-containing protein, partial [Clostridia bacterium]|nr:DnaJ C-terminal domain-containing protein [Clostridia bacterium]